MGITYKIRGYFNNRIEVKNMIDTIKIYSEISKDIFDVIHNNSIVKLAVNNNTDQMLYEITNDHLQGSFDTRLSVRVGSGEKYNFCSKGYGYYIEIEGSYHKWVLGYNSHNGYYDLQFIVENLISNVELTYDVRLPLLDKWYLQRVDVAICFDLHSNDNVRSYINSLSRCNYPRRNIKFYSDESLYLSGTTTTLKIYNKLLEFRKHDIKRLNKCQFDIEKYLDTIDGFVRFECEIKKKKLIDLVKCENNLVCVNSLKYEDLKKVWSDEFMKLLKLIENDLKVVRGREEVLKRLQSMYKPRLVNVLFNFYCSIQLNGVEDVKNFMSSTSFYRNLNYLKDARVDISQAYKIEEISYFSFNPFEYEEVV